MTHLPNKWRERLLDNLLAPTNTENMRFLDAWARAEGGTAENNPLNTTYPMPWSTLYNTHPGVRNFGTALEGIGATASTFGRDKITNAYYVQLWMDLQTGVYTAEQLVGRNREALTKWGSNPDLMLRVLAGI